MKFWVLTYGRPSDSKTPGWKFRQKIGPNVLADGSPYGNGYNDQANYGKLLWTVQALLWTLHNQMSIGTHLAMY